MPSPDTRSSAAARSFGSPGVPSRRAATSVALRDIHKGFRLAKGSSVQALAGIDLEIERSEIVTIVGASGSGKSTLLRIIAGLESPDRGSVHVAGELVEGPAPERGLIFQESRLLPWMNVEQNVAFGISELPRAEREAIVARWIARVGLVGFEHAYPHELSGGMAQRVSIARALAPGPAVLLLDEPFGALDALTRLRMQDELSNLWRDERTTLVLVTHDVEEALFLGHRVVVMSERPGRIRSVLRVDLERPRDRTSEAFLALRRSLLDEFFTDPPPGRPPEPAQ
jgi:sulfonate transport system ATP-binding protein